MHSSIQHKNPGPQVLISDWLSRLNHKTIRDEEIPGISVTINAMESCIDIPDCMTTDKIRLTTLDNEHLGRLS